MASACVNTIPTTSATTYTTYKWLSPREPPSSTLQHQDSPDFEFRLGCSTNDDTMLPADELFSDGKLVPLQFSGAKTNPLPARSLPVEKYCKPISEDPGLFSPKAPRCSSRWRDLFGLKKQQPPKTTSCSPSLSSLSNTGTNTSSSSSSSTGSKSMRLFLNRNSKTVSSSSVDSLPLLKDSCSSSSSLDLESISVSSSRLSLSSSSSGHDHDELPRASLDAEKPVSHRSGPKVRTRPRVRKENRTRGVSVDSPRMNPSGKVVFQSLERSSSSPSSFNGGPRYKHHSSRNGVMERSYSANVHVRITPVLNVPVCSLRGSSKSGVFGFGQFFSSHSQKKEGSNNGSVKTKDPGV